MATKKIKLPPPKVSILKRGDALRGNSLRVPVTIGNQVNKKLQAMIRAMVERTEKEVKAMLAAKDYDGDYSMAMDVNTGSKARVLFDRLYGEFEKSFSKAADPIADTMIKEASKASATAIKSSIKEMVGNLQFSHDVITEPMREMIAARSAEAAGLIKRVPAKYLDRISTTVFEAITKGAGLKDIRPALDKYKVQVKNWAHHVALDQTRKVYNGLNQGRMEAIGVEEYEWVHSGGSNQPRPYHKDVLNGKIFRFDDPPIIDQKTGERGKPGDAINCRCTMRPIVRFS